MQNMIDMLGVNEQVGRQVAETKPDDIAVSGAARGEKPGGYAVCGRVVPRSRLPRGPGGTLAIARVLAGMEIGSSLVPGGVWEPMPNPVEKACGNGHEESGENNSGDRFSTMGKSCSLAYFSKWGAARWASSAA